MRSLRTKTWAKVVAGVLCVVCLSAAALSVGPVQELAAQGGYETGGYDKMRKEAEQALLADLVYEVYVLYEAQQNQPGSTPDLDGALAESNFFYTIKDARGKTLAASRELGDYRARTSETFTIVYEGEEVTVRETYPSEAAREKAERTIQAEHPDAYFEWENEAEGYLLTATYQEGYREETVFITGFLRAEVVSAGSKVVYDRLCQVATLWAAKDEMLAALVVGSLVGLLSLGFLVWAAGRREGTDEIALHWADTHVPLELPVLLLLFALFGLGLPWQTFSPGLGMVSALRVLWVLLCQTLSLALLLSLVRRIKAKVLWDTLLLRRLDGERLAASLPLVWKTALGFLLACVLEGLCIAALVFGNGVELLWVLLKLAEGALLLRVVLSLRTLQRGGRRLAAGDLDYQIPLDGLRGDLRAHGENLNSIRAAIQAAVEDQMKSERMKTELITNVSHDIKTPLTSIVNYVDLLKKQAMPTEEARTYLEVLDRQSGKLKKLTEDLVEAAKASTGSLPVNFQRTDVNVLLSQSAGEYQEKLQRRDLQLLLAPAEDNPAISADGRLLWRVVENLLNNVSKYALPGTRVYLTCQASEDQVRITFRNISAEPLNLSAEELTERFVRGDDARHTEGSGLGLCIAKSLTELQKGTFDLDIDGDLFKVVLTFPRVE